MSQDQPLKVDGHPALVLGPDDTLVVVLPIGTSRREFDQLRVDFADRFGGRVLLIAGAEQLAVLRNEASK
jgi:hypothetical protein